MHPCSAGSGGEPKHRFTRSAEARPRPRTAGSAKADTAVLLDRYPMRMVGTEITLNQAGISVVAQTTSASTALALLVEHTPELFVIDAGVVEGAIAAPSFIEKVRQRSAEVRIVALLDQHDPLRISALLQAGATACVTGSLMPGDVCATIGQLERQSVRLGAGRPVMAPELRPYGLTRRELEVTARASEGQTNEEIASALGVKAQTVKFHLSNVYRKLGVRSRTAAARCLYSVVPRSDDPAESRSPARESRP